MFTPSPGALKEVRAKLIVAGTSFSAFCAREGFVRQAVAAALSGKRRGPKSIALAERFLEAVRRAE